MIKAIAQSAKLVGFVMLFAFVFQTISAQAEHAGLMECVSDAGKTDSNSQEPSHSSDECCIHVMAISQQDIALAWGSPLAVSFDVQDDVLPDGPTLAIDQPPRLA
jgi:acid phosphatase class B